MKKDQQLTDAQSKAIEAYMKASYHASFGRSKEDIENWLNAGKKVIEVAPKSQTAKSFKRIDKDHWLSILE
jgi:hypothetical protein